jgi:hypothetical protein
MRCPLLTHICTLFDEQSMTQDHIPTFRCLCNIVVTKDRLLSEHVVLLTISFPCLGGQITESDYFCASLFSVVVSIRHVAAS